MRLHTDNGRTWDCTQKTDTYETAHRRWKRARLYTDNGNAWICTQMTKTHGTAHKHWKHMKLHTDNENTCVCTQTMETHETAHRQWKHKVRQHHVVPPLGFSPNRRTWNLGNMRLHTGNGNTWDCTQTMEARETAQTMERVKLHTGDGNARDCTQTMETQDAVHSQSKYMRLYTIKMCDNAHRQWHTWDFTQTTETHASAHRQWKDNVRQHHVTRQGYRPNRRCSNLRRLPFYTVVSHGQCKHKWSLISPRTFATGHGHEVHHNHAVCRGFQPRQPNFTI